MRTRFNYARHYAALFIVASVLVAGPVGAQQSAPPRGADTTGMEMMGMMMNDCPMMTAMTQGPAATLDRRKALALTEDQVRQLEAARARETAAAQPAMDSMRVLHDRLAPLADAPQFDESRVRAVFERMGGLHADMGVAVLRARYEARAVLTPVQRQKLADTSAGMKDMNGMMSGMMNGMMNGMMSSGAAAHCPMMQGMTQGKVRGTGRDSAAAKSPRPPKAGMAPADHHDHMMGTKPSVTKPSPTKP